MPQWEFLIVEVAADTEGVHDGFRVEVEAGFMPLSVRGSDEMRNALAGHSHYEVVFARREGEEPRAGILDRGLVAPGP